MFDKFTNRAKQVIKLAKREAQRLNHNYLGTEHILLGLLKLGQGVAVNVLRNLNIDFERCAVKWKSSWVMDLKFRFMETLL
jgi:ATP-dependent Clp protease ATP-binding subunit ClpC